MKPPKPWRSDGGGGLLHLALLLSLAGLRADLEPDLPLLLLRGEPRLGAGPCPAWGGLPKGAEPDPATAAAAAAGRLLREVRALGAPFVRRTRVDAWLVHGVAAGAADGAPGLAGGADGGDPRAAAGQQETEPAPAGPAAPGRDVGARAREEDGVLGERHETVDHSCRQEENEQRVLAEKEKSLLQKKEDESKVTDKPDWDTERPTESQDERHPNETETFLSLEDLFQLLSSQPENSLEAISPGETPLFGSLNDGMNFSVHNINFSQAISQDVSLHEAMLRCPTDSTFRRDPAARALQPQEPFLQLNSPTTNPEQTFSGTNWTGLFPYENQVNVPSQDLQCDLDINIFGEINLMSLAPEGGFDIMEASKLFEEPDSDSGLSLNSSHNSSSITKAGSLHSTFEGALGYSSDLESASYQDSEVEGAVGGYSPEPSKLCHMNHRSDFDSGLNGDLAFQHVFHNHTYHLQSNSLESTSESFSWPGKSQKLRSKYFNDTDGNLSRDERRVKALHIPFSVEEIVRMPVDSFNSMLSRSYLTDLQVSLIRDIRRRGKNKVAAQNCRKRKLDIILNLENDVCSLEAKKEDLEREKAQYNRAINMMKQKLHCLYQDVFSWLRDDEGQPVNPNQYALQCNHDGSVLIVPKELMTSGHKKENQKGKRKK